MRLQPIVDRLAGLGFATVDGVAALPQAENLAQRLPAAFVAPEGWSAASNTLGTQMISQRLSHRIAVLIFTGGQARQAGKIADDIDRLEKAVMARLAGWRHPEAQGPGELLDGAFAGVAGDTLVWRLRFAWTTLERHDAST